MHLKCFSVNAFMAPQLHQNVCVNASKYHFRCSFCFLSNGKIEFVNTNFI